MQKLYRDSKGRFVSERDVIGTLKGWIESVGWISQKKRVFVFGTHAEVQIKHRLNINEIAGFIRRFRNKHKIYETF